MLTQGQTNRQIACVWLAQACPQLIILIIIFNFHNTGCFYYCVHYSTTIGLMSIINSSKYILSLGNVKQENQSSDLSVWLVSGVRGRRI